MTATIVLAQPKREGFNRAVALAARKALAAGSPVPPKLLDLYADGFDPVLSSEELVRKISLDDATLRYQDALMEADRIVFVHPDWWGGPPAVLKGFLDRTLRPGVAYGQRETDFNEDTGAGLFTGKRADVLITTDARKPENEGKWPPSEVWKRHVLSYCGFSDIRVHVFWGMRDSSYAARKAWLDGVALLLA
jgi:putative NADPH-quinone reductase